MSKDKLKDGQTPTKSIRTQRRANLPKITPKDMFSIWIEKELGIPCEKEHKFHPVRKWRFDYAVPTAKVALEVEGGVWTGGRHTSPKGFLGDIEKYNTATLMGWKVLRTTPDELMTAKTMDILKSAVFGNYEGEIEQKTPKTRKK